MPFWGNDFWWLNHFKSLLLFTLFPFYVVQAPTSTAYRSSLFVRPGSPFQEVNILLAFLCVVSDSTMFCYLLQVHVCRFFSPISSCSMNMPPFLYSRCSRQLGWSKKAQLSLQDASPLSHTAKLQMVWCLFIYDFMTIHMVYLLYICEYIYIYA